MPALDATTDEGGFWTPHKGGCLLLALSHVSRPTTGFYCSLINGGLEECMAYADSQTIDPLIQRCSSHSPDGLTFDAIVLVFDHSHSTEWVAEEGLKLPSLEDSVDGMAETCTLSPLT